jgi:hypothetical protein
MRLLSTRLLLAFECGSGGFAGGIIGIRILPLDVEGKEWLPISLDPRTCALSGGHEALSPALLPPVSKTVVSFCAQYFSRIFFTLSMGFTQ